MQVIVSEMHKPDWQRTIKPLDAGGVAGGIKFMKNSIFFKFTLDHEGLYSGDEFAAKAAGRELQGLEAYFSYILAKGPQLFTAMQMLIDCSGYRLIASSLLPLSKTSLKYGSNDGGNSVHADDPELNKIMEDAGRHLNQKKHQVAGTDIYAPADIEGHLGSDGLYYVLDTARVFPPETPPRYFQVSRDTVQCVVCCALWTMPCCVLCTLYFVLCAVCRLLCTMDYALLCTVYSVFCTVETRDTSALTVLCVLSAVQLFVVYCVLCILECGGQREVILSSCLKDPRKRRSTPS